MSFGVKTTYNSSNPLFSSIVTLYALILLYLPNRFTTIVFSPVLILTAALLLALLYLAASQTQKSPFRNGQNDKETGSDEQTEEDHEWPETDSDPETGLDSSPSSDGLFVLWDLKAPLEVIYEEDEDENDVGVGIERYRSLSRYFPESESDNSSEGDFSGMGFWDSPEDLRFKWEEEDRDEGLIEIALDGNDSTTKKKEVLDFQVDEDNFIEIDISTQIHTIVS